MARMAIFDRPSSIPKIAVLWIRFVIPSVRFNLFIDLKIAAIPIEVILDTRDVAFPRKKLSQQVETL